MKHLLLALMIAAASPAMSAPQGPWPEEARGLGLPKAEWILVVPARRLADGSVSVWNRDDEWTGQWIVPRQTPAGVRTVAIVGDAEDRRMVDGTALDVMDASVLSRLAAKYRAPAVAVAITDSRGEVAVAGWIKGAGASWIEASGAGGREGSLAAMDMIFTGGGGEASFDVAITGQRMNGGWMEYRIEVYDPIIEDVISQISGVEVVATAGPQALVVRVTDGRDVETALRSAGLSLRN